MSRRLARTILTGVMLMGACHKAPDAPPAASSTTAPAVLDAVNAPVYMCPMDRDIRGHAPGKCPRCGMTLVTSIPDPVEYHVDLATDATLRPGIPAHLTFQVVDPWKGHPVTQFTEVHERLYHAFVVSRDLQFFMHGHPQLHDGAFDLSVTFPRPGMYRILSDFYPEASTPQLIANTIFVAGGGTADATAPDAAPISLPRDYTPKQDVNLGTSLVSVPEEPVAGMPARLRFALSPSDGFEKYLGVWGHMLIASDDLIDMMHTHPSIADGGAEVEFSVVFPRAHTYRIWVQFQRHGTVNTMHFDIPVKPMPADDDVVVAAASAGATHERR